MCSGYRARIGNRRPGRAGSALLLLGALVCAEAVARPQQDDARPSLAPEISPPPVAPRLGAEKPGAEFSIDRICALIEGAATAHGLPAAYFARLIWKESRFDIGAISPKGAQGIAQFMPGTARLEGLADPFDPLQAIPASARHLSDLRAEFGNLGLAAAAYNSGRNRVARWLSGASGLPWETLDYVQSITYRPADWFRERSREVEPRPLDGKRSFAEACRRLPIMKTRAVFHAGAQMQPWGAQVAGGVSQGAAAGAFERVKRRFPAAIGGEEPLIVRNRRGMGLRYVAQVGAPSRAAAQSICTRLARAGAACMVRRN